MGAARHDTLPIDRRYNPGLEALSWPSEDMLEFRRQFVVRMGWFKEPYTDDSDRYDTDPSTIHFMERDEDGAILSGMRLARLESIDESLSVGMLESNKDMHKTVMNFGQTIDYTRTDVWDLTRLVHRFGDDDGFEESIESAQAIFGAGLAKTEPESEGDLLWIFATTELILDFLHSRGIKTEQITQGKLKPSDGEDTHFHVIRPVPAMQFLRDNQNQYGRTYSSVERGFRGLGEIWVK